MQSSNVSAEHYLVFLFNERWHLSFFMHGVKKTVSTHDSSQLFSESTKISSEVRTDM